MKTVKVKVAVAVDPSGKWNASGWSDKDGKAIIDDAMDIALQGVDEGETTYWLEAELPVLEVKTIKAKVSKEE